MKKPGAHARFRCLNNTLRRCSFRRRHIAELSDGTRFRSDDTVDGLTTIAIMRPDLKRLYRIELNDKLYSTIELTPEMEAMASSDMEEDQSGSTLLQRHSILARLMFMMCL